MKIGVIACLAALAALPAPAATYTVTFDEEFVEDLGDSFLMRSQGFEYQTSTLYSYFDDVTLHDDGGILESRISRGGTAFTPLSIDLSGLSNIYRTGTGPVPDPEDDEDRFEGWVRGGTTVAPFLRLTGLFETGPAVEALFTGPLDTLTTFVFGSEFAGITDLVLTVVLPDEIETDTSGAPRHVMDTFELTRPGQLWCDAYCAEFHADNLVVAGTPPAPVPLPAAGLALVAGLAALGAVRRSRR